MKHVSGSRRDRCDGVLLAMPRGAQRCLWAVASLLAVAGPSAAVATETPEH